MKQYHETELWQFGASPMVKNLALGAAVIVAAALIAVGLVDELWHDISFVITGVCVVAVSFVLVLFLFTKPQIFVKFDVGAQIVELGAPFYRARLKKAEIIDIKVGDDDGMNSGIFNWYIVGKSNSKKGVRINAGGKAHLQILLSDGRKYQVVLPTRRDAEKIASEIQ